MESYTYDFTYTFTIIYFRTLYYVTTETCASSFRITLDDGAVSMPTTAKLRTTPDGKELAVSQIPLSSTITSETRYLNKDVIKQLREQIQTCLQVAHQKQADSFTFRVEGLFCLEPVINLLQIVLREHKGVFRTITFCCPNDAVKSLYLSVFSIVSSASFD